MRPFEITLRPTPTGSTVHFGAKTVRNISLLIVAFFGPFLQTPLEKISKTSYLYSIGQWANDHSFSIVFVTLSIGACECIMAYIGTPKVWKAVKGFLDNLQKEVFKDARHVPHRSRVTLFKKCRCCWWLTPSRSPLWAWGYSFAPWSGWLIPICRSGHTSLRTDTVFRACDDHPEKFEGVAGKVWIDNGYYSRSIPHNLETYWEEWEDAVKALKELPKQRITSNIEDAEIDKIKRRIDKTRKRLDVEISKFVSESGLPPTWVEKRLKKGKSCPRWLCGIPIEVNNKPWGVLVIDSDSAPFDDDEKVFKERFEHTGKLLNSLLEAL